MSVKAWKEFLRAHKAARGPTPCPTVEISYDWLVQWADDYHGPPRFMVDAKGDVGKFLKFLTLSEVANLAETLPRVLERLQGEAQQYFLGIARMWHWLQVYLNEESGAETACRPLLADGVKRLVGTEQTRLPLSVWDALDEHLTLTLEKSAWSKSDLLRMHECLTGRELVLDPGRCYPTGVAQVPEVGRFYWVYQWPKQALWLELERMDPPAKVNFKILGAAVLTSPWVTGYTTAESLTRFYKHFEALEKCVDCPS